MLLLPWEVCSLRGSKWFKLSNLLQPVSLSQTFANVKSHKVNSAMAAPAFTPSTREADVGRSLWIPDQSDLHSESQDSQGCYKEKPCLENN